MQICKESEKKKEIVEIANRGWHKVIKIKLWLLFFITETKLYQQPNFSLFYYFWHRGDQESKPASKPHRCSVSSQDFSMT